MADDEEILNIVIQEFPELKDEITELFTESISFQELCEDYVYCLKTIESTDSSGNPGREKELDELRGALGELKDELMSRVS